MINRKVLSVIGNIFIYFVALGLFGSAMAKLMNEKSVTEALNLLNLTNPIPVGILEMTCALLLAFPPTRRIGILMCSAYIGGIIVAENALNGKPYGGFLLGVILWTGVFLRQPSFFGVKPQKNNSSTTS